MFRFGDPESMEQHGAPFEIDAAYAPNIPNAVTLQASIPVDKLQILIPLIVNRASIQTVSRMRSMSRMFANLINPIEIVADRMIKRNGSLALESLYHQQPTQTAPQCFPRLELHESVACMVATRLLAKGADVHAGERTGMFWPAYYGHENVIGILVMAGLDIADGEQAAFLGAVMGGQLSLVQTLIDDGADVNGRGGEIFVECAAVGSLELLDMLIDAGADVARYGKQAIRRVLSLGLADTQVLDRLLSMYGNVDNTWMAVTAARRGHLLNVQMVLAAGARVTSRSIEETLRTLANDGEALAVSQATDQIMDFMFETLSGPLFKLPNLLLDAVSLGLAKTAERLLDAGANVNAKSTLGLALAVKSGDTDTVRLLLERGAVVNAREGLALLTASEKNEMEIVQLLINHGAQIDPIYEILLWRAAKNGSIGILRLLMEANGMEQAPNLQDLLFTCWAHKTFDVWRWIDDVERKRERRGFRFVREGTVGP